MNQPELFPCNFVRCLRCGRILTDPVSIARGVGPECWKKRGKEKPMSMKDIIDRIDRAIKLPMGPLVRGELRGIRGMVKEMEGRCDKQPRN